MAMPDRDLGERDIEGLTLDQVIGNLRKPDLMSDAEWQRRLRPYDVIMDLKGVPKDNVPTSPYGDGVANHFTVDPFAEDNEPGPLLLSPVILRYSPTGNNLIVQTMVRDGRRINPSFIKIATKDLVNAANGEAREMALRAMKGRIRDIALVAARRNEMAQFRRLS